MKSYRCRCGQTFAWNQLVPGQELQCPSCDGTLRVPLAGKKKQKQPKQPQLAISARANVVVAAPIQAGTRPAKATQPKRSMQGKPGVQALTETVISDMPKFDSGRGLTAVRDSVELPKGTLLANRFRVIERVGRGGMSDVYSAMDESENVVLAIKVLRREMRADPKARSRFAEEARLLDGFRHPHIARVFGFHDTGSFPFLTMELLKGETLRSVIERRARAKRRFEPKEVIRIMQQVGSALAAIHEKGLVHRDIKPENLWYALDGDIKVMDFGIAKKVDSPQLTPVSGIAGSAYYMAPEQLTSDGKVTHRSDQFALAVVLYELLSGSIPVGALSDLSLDNSRVPPNLAKAILRALSPKADHRFDSASAFTQQATAVKAMWNGRTKVLFAMLAIALCTVLAAGWVAANKKVLGASNEDYASYEERHENGAKMLSGYLDEDGQRTGAWNAWYEKGQPWISNANFLHGKPLGTWQVMNETGELMGVIENGLRVGEWECLSDDRKILAVGAYNARGEPEGEWSFSESKSNRPLVLIRYRAGHIDSLELVKDSHTYSLEYNPDYTECRLQRVIYKHPSGQEYEARKEEPRLTAYFELLEDAFKSFEKEIERFQWQPMLTPLELPHPATAQESSSADKPFGILELIRAVQFPTDGEINESLAEAMPTGRGGNTESNVVFSIGDYLRAHEKAYRDEQNEQTRLREQKIKEQEQEKRNQAEKERMLNEQLRLDHARQIDRAESQLRELTSLDNARKVRLNKLQNEWATLDREAEGCALQLKTLELTIVPLRKSLAEQRSDRERFEQVLNELAAAAQVPPSRLRDVFEEEAARYRPGTPHYNVAVATLNNYITCENSLSNIKQIEYQLSAELRELNKTKGGLQSDLATLGKRLKANQSEIMTENSLIDSNQRAITEIRDELRRLKLGSSS